MGRNRRVAKLHALQLCFHLEVKALHNYIALLEVY